MTVLDRTRLTGLLLNESVRFAHLFFLLLSYFFYLINFIILVNNFFMIVEIISISIVIVLLYMGAIEKLFYKPYVYKKMDLKLNRNFSLYKLSLLSTNENLLLVLPFLQVFVKLGEINLNIKWKIEDKVIKKIYEKRKYIEIYKNCSVNVDRTGITFRGKINFYITISKPNCDYILNLNNGTLKINKKYLLKFENFEHIEADKGNAITLNLKVNDVSKIKFINFGFLYDENKYRATLRNFFGFYDVNSWDYMPQFNIENCPKNQLKFNYLKQLLNESNKIVNIPHFDFIESSNTKYINLSKFGFSKIIKLNLNKNKITIIDVLCNFEVQLLCDYIKVERFCFFNIDYLYIQLKKGTLIYNFYPRLFNNEFLFKNLIDFSLVDISTVWNLKNILLNINRLMLHGYFIDVYLIFKKINYCYLNDEMKLLFANLLMTYITVFKKYELFKDKNLKGFLFEIFKYAIQHKCDISFCFLKKLLPFIKNDKISNKILDIVLDCKKYLKSTDYEYLFSEYLGLRLSGHTLFIDIKYHIAFTCELWLKGHKIKIKKLKDSKIMKIDGIILTGVDFINLDNYGKEILIEFVN